jgi:tetratricopeptide (TPR) repeat protein
MRSTDEQTPIRERWTSHRTGDGDEATAGALFRMAATVSIGEKRLAEIHARLRSSTRKQSRTVSPAWRFVRRLAFAAAMACAGGGLYASAKRALDRSVPEGSNRRPDSKADKAPLRRAYRPGATPVEAAPAVTPDPPALAAAPSVPGPDEQPAASALSVPTQQPSPSTKRPLRPGRLIATREAATSATPASQPRAMERPAGVSASAPALGAMPAVPWPSPIASPATQAPVVAPIAAPVAPAGVTFSADGPSSLARESRLLARAIAKLRQDDEPEQALRILDDYRVQFTSGALAPEAAATRIEALLRVGRNREALALLDTQNLTARGVAREMLVARAELRADKGRYTAALADFEAVLSTSFPKDSLAERALAGRATCREKSADSQGARRDWEDYLAKFPHGGFAARARAALGKLP